MNKVKKLTNKSLDFLYNALWQEKEQWVLWIPVLFGFGIWLNICLELSVSWIALLSGLFIGILTSCFLYKKEWYTGSLFAGVFCITLLGFSWAKGYAVLINSPCVTKQTKTLEIIGKLEDIQFYRDSADRIRFVIKLDSGNKIKEEGFKYKQWVEAGKPKDKSDFGYYRDYKGSLPYRVRLNIRTETNNAQIGDRIRLKAKLTPNPTPVYPGAYDFSKKAYYDRIGAVGFAISDVEVLDIELGIIGSFQKKMSNLRLVIAEKIRSAIDYPESGVAVALLTGIRGMIERQNIDDMRFAGLAHLLAISGLHLGIVVGLFFFLSRYLFTLNEHWALYHSTKKWAAWIGLIIGFTYLMITNFPVSATRAYIMVALMLGSILFDRDPSPFRSVALAAMIIMLINPAVLMSAGFHMSFSAVIGLISGFALVKRWGIKTHTQNKWMKIPIYSLNILIASIIAEFAIAPFSLYHFNNYTQYGMFANLFAMPLTSFLVMPFGVLSFVLMPFGLEKFALIPMSWGIDGILKIAEYTVNLPYAVHIISEIQLLSICLIVIGGLWFWIWQEEWRYFGVVIAICGVVVALFRQVPDIIVDSRSETFVITDNGGQLYFSQELRSGFKEFTWLLRTGNEIPEQSDGGVKTLKDYPDYESIQCYKSYCHFFIKSREIYVALNGYGLQKGCRKGRYNENVIVLDSRKKRYKGDEEFLRNGECDGVNLVQGNDKNDVYSIYLGEKLDFEVRHSTY